jgi:hypothetical protein
VSAASRRWWTFEHTYVQAVYDRVHTDDCAYFAARPGCRSRLRAFVPGEARLEPLRDGQRYTHALITQIGPGVHLRRYATEASR